MLVVHVRHASCARCAHVQFELCICTMLVVLVVHMRDATPHVMYDFSHSVSGDTEVGVSDNCMQVKVMQDSDTGEGTSDEIASLCKGARHQVGDF